MAPQTTPMNNYQDEMCERLIQLSFAKIVNSKNERGGARLRKNLLILHLLQKARTEQRTRLYVVTSTPMDEDENIISSSNDDVVDCDHDRVDDDDDNNVTDDDSHSNLRRNNHNNENHLALIEATTNDEFVDEHNNNDTKNGVEENLSDVGFVVPLSPFVQVMKMDCSSDEENNSSIDERNNILNDSQGTRRNNNGDASSTYDENNIEISSLNNNNNTLKKCCANSSDEDESSSDNDDSDSACSDDDVSSPPCVRCKRKRKLTDGSDTNGDILFSNKRTCSLSASSTTQQLQGLITVFKNGLSSMNGNVESSSSGNNSDDINGRDNTLTSSDSSTASYVVGSRQQNNLNRTLSCPAIWELTCAS